MKKLSMLLFMVLTIIACDKKSEGQALVQETYTVKKQDLKSLVYFSGEVKPIAMTSISSPVEGTIAKRYFIFGEQVKKAQRLFTLDSSQLEKNYNQVLTEYLKAKDDYANAKTKFTGTEDLWGAGLISRNNYMSEKSSLNNSYVTLLQKQKQLDEMLQKIGGNQTLSIKDIDISDIEAVEKALNTQVNLLLIRAPLAGVVLKPAGSGDKNDNGKGLEIGSEVKDGQALALIGDLEGIAVDIKVSEIDLEKIKSGQQAVVTGVAFPNIRLQGQIQSINTQASTSLGAAGSLPTFAARVVVPKLTEEQKKYIKVGMSAKVEVQIVTADAIAIPISAVFELQEKTAVKVKRGGKMEMVIITTGATTAGKVQVMSGLQDGDVIIIETEALD